MKRGNGIQVSDSGQRDACVSARSRGSRMDSVGLPRILLRCRFLGLMPEPGTRPLPRVLVGLQAQVRGALTPRAARLSAAGPPLSLECVYTGQDLSDYPWWTCGNQITLHSEAWGKFHPAGQHLGYT